MFIRKHLFSLLAASLLAAPVVALAGPTYSMTVLPDGFEGRALGHDGLVAGSYHSSSASGGATWSGGSLTLYGSLGITSINGVSSNGMFTGSLRTAGMTNDHAFIYHSGIVDDIGGRPHVDTAGNAINAAGQVVGEWCCNGPYGGAFYYQSGSMTDLGPLDTSAAAINEAGVAVGGMLPPGTTYHAYKDSGGVLTDLGTPTGFGSFANGINNSGDIVGYMWDWFHGGPSHAFLYAGGTLLDLGTFGGTRAHFAAINDSGLIVGTVTTGPSSTYGLLYSSGVAQDLNALVSGAGGWTITEADAINGAGQILGSACDAYGNCRDVLLNPLVDPVPEPATAALLLAGFGGLAWSRRRRTRAPALAQALA